MKQAAVHYHLAGDIGGTKTSLGLYDSGQGPLSPLAEITVQNDTAAGLEDIIVSFLDQMDVQPISACFGVAGPIMNNRVRMTNLEWSIDGEKLGRQLGIGPVILINDLVATARGAVVLPEEKLFAINGGRPDKNAAIAIIAPGTGLGQSFLIRHRGRLLPSPSEGGHCSFAPVNELQEKLLRFMSARLGHVSYEQVCSGLGLPHLYDFLLAEHWGEEQSPPLLPAKNDRTIAIVDAALEAKEKADGGNRIAAQTLELFVDILASEAANLVLKVLATGGLFIGGGLPPRILPYLRRETFMPSFSKGIYRQMLSSIPVHVIMEPNTALIGAAAYAFDMHDYGDMRED